MNLRQIAAFRAVMDCGSMTIAARTMGISQPNVSRLIAELEDSIELQLFERRAGRLLATAEGSAFHLEVERLFGGLDSLRQAATDIRVSGRGSLRIAATFSFTGSILPSAIRELRERYPAAVVSLQIRSSATILQWAAAQQCDVGLAWNVSEVPEVDVEPLLIFPGVCVLPSDHRLASKPAIRPDDLRNEPFISFTVDDSMRKRIDGVFEERRIPRRLVMETQYSAAIYALVAEGVGVSIANPVPIREFGHRALHIRRFVPEIMLESFILRPRQRPQNRLAQDFIEILKKTMSEERKHFDKVLSSTPRTRRLTQGRAAAKTPKEAIRLSSASN
ncbi:MAG: LysR family transcriptional regulator [Proteobacteria bacterium]|nr:LysR family transcriptional regulator [Pseudomonadota bacterium]